MLRLCAMEQPEDLHAAGHALAMKGDFAAAEAWFRRALAADPDRSDWWLDVALALLGQGRYREGFALYARRPAPRPELSVPEWSGESLAGRHILLFPEQGFGDQIQFARFAPLLRELGAEVTLFCAPQLARLFQSLGVRVIAAAGAVEFPDPDCWSMLMDVPGKLGLTLDSIPAEPYLAATPRASSNRVGVATRGNARTEVSRYKFIPPDLPLPFEAMPLHPQQTGARDFRDTADIIAGLDLVISVDTAIAHLAGALGVPTWLLLPAEGADWRWLQGRADSPWYPSFRLYRQPEPGDWISVLEAVRADLAANLILGA